MAEITLKVTGINEILNKAEAKLSKQVIDAVLQTSLVTSAAAVLSELQANTPVDTGNLRDSEFIEYGQGFSALIAPGFNVQPHYAADVEYGFHHYGSGKFIQGQHYVEKTTIVMQNVVSAIFRNNFKQLLS